MTKFYKGIAGARGSAPLGIVFHNDAGSQNANANFYRNWLPTHNAENGFAHYYVASDGIYQSEDEKNMAWHTANANGNANYIGIEICQSMGDEKTFRENEQKAFKLGAEICKRYGWTPNYNLFPLHKEFSSTSCPHRSSDLHGQSVQAVRQYFTDQVMKYYNGQGNANTQTNNKGGIVTMYAIYWIPNKSGKGEDAYFFNGVAYEYINHPDAVQILKQVYQDNNGKAIPEYHWKNGAPWWVRLEQPVVNLQDMANKIDKIVKKTGA